MARVSLRLRENSAGSLFVDGSCIDCDTCRQVAPASFAEGDGHAFVHRQPESSDERRRAAMALVSCPTSSIGIDRTLGDALDIIAASQQLPEPIADGVFYNGYAAESSYGASSYFIQREGGNVLVDSPRAARPLLQRINSLGGAKLLFLTHRDDVADHAILHDRLGCDRLLHRSDLDRGTADIERPLDFPSGGDDPIRLAPDLLVIPLPGHTRGSAALLYRDTFLFTGDHLWWSPARSALHASRSVCWYSWSEQTRSMGRLLDFSFEWVLPGHGRRFHAASPSAMRAEVERCWKWMRGRGG